MRQKPNVAAIRRIGWIIGRMRREALMHHAAVFRAEASTGMAPFKILVFTMLSSRTKDDTTLGAVERLFRVASTPEKIAAMPLKKLERTLYGVGFYHVKARHLSALCRTISRNGRGGGKVPDNLEGLLELPGVGRKTANIVLARAFGKNTLGVDVHVHRISNRLGIVRTKKPEETEKALMKVVPLRLVRRLNRSFVAFGQTVCLPRNPKCPVCPINNVCQKVGVYQIISSKSRSGTR